MASSKEASTWDYELTARPAAAQNRGAGRRGPDAQHGKSGVVRVLALSLMFFIGALLTAVPPSSAEPPEPPFLDLGTLPADTMSGASAVNEAGQVVGWSQGSYPDPIHAFLWEDGTMTDLGAREGYTSRAFAISDVGQIVGTSNEHAILWENGTMRDLGNTNAFDVNDEGQIVGWGLARSGQFTAVLWTTPFPPPLTSLTRLGQLGVSVTVATAINPAGQVVGFAKEDACDADPFIWENGTIARLSTPFDCARAFDINAAGQVAGSGTYRFAGDDGFLWDHGVTTELLSPDGQSTYA